MLSAVGRKSHGLVHWCSYAPSRRLSSSFLHRIGLATPSSDIDDTRSQWINVPAAVTNHLCLGSIFAWSILNEPLTRISGVVAPAPLDWALGDISLTFSLVMGGFAWGAVLSRYIDTIGPRASCTLGALSLGTGFGLGALAIHLHSLPILYTAGAVWGLANGWAYVPPVANLLKWFPDSKGFASGACLVGFGGGAVVAAPLFTKLLETFRVSPEFIGRVEDIELSSQSSGLFAQVGEDLKQVVVATSNDASALGIQEGVYLLGTGSTGAAETFLCLGALYSSAMLISSQLYRIPIRPHCTSDVSLQGVSISEGMRAPQFWLMWTGFGLAITGSYGIISIGKTMLTECFGTAAPELVTASFAASFVGGMSLANLGGRVAWSNLSDLLARRHLDPFFGRKTTFSLMWGSGPLFYLATIWSIHQIGGSLHQMLPLLVFSGSVFGILASFGGAAATRPALTGDIFGLRHVGVMTARQLSVVLPAAFLGPKIVAYFREKSIREAIHDLAGQVGDVEFKQAFGGVGKIDIDLLIEQKTVTLGRLLELVPDTVIDPSPFVYDETLYVMAGLQFMAFLTNQLLKPIPKSKSS